MLNEQSPSIPSSTAPDFNKLELEILQFWKDQKIFEKSLEQTKDKEPFIFYDGPPFATGLPHYGSILPSVYKDAIPRYQTMKGKYVRRRWGWDCHGLPIENIVEQHLKISGKKQIEEIGVERFNQVCRENVLTYVAEWGKVIERIGRWVEFDNSYKTMDTSYMESVWWAVKEIWEKGLIYEDRKVLLYCSRCETPISNFEVAMDNSYRDVTEESVYVKFKLQPRQRIADFLTTEQTYALAWTTTPWTLPGNTALNVGPEIQYVLVKQADNHFILAKDRLAVLDGDYELLSEFSARALEGMSYEPLYPGMVANPENRAHKIYAEDFVTTTDGTGIVHNAAMYGEEDYEAAKRRNLPRHDMLDHKGQYLPEAPESLRGVFFKDADRIVLTELSEKGLVYKTETYTHSYPHCYRCGTPLFINIQEIKSKLLQLNESISWYPSYLKHGRFAKSVEAAPDWNISRNRYWATALPFWKCENKDCKNIVCVGSIAELQEKSTNFNEVYPDYTLDPNPSTLAALDLHRPYIDRVKLRCDTCQGQMQRIPEVIDCWVESGSMPFAELHAPFENQELFKQRFPADFVVEYIPQTRAWFYVMHVISTILFDRAPFKQVVTTGTILAEDGQKMSKSKQNFPDPSLIIQKYGVDALRFYLLTSPVVVGEDMNFSEKGVAEVARKVTMIVWNVWSFYRTYAHGPVSEAMPSSRHMLDVWIQSRLVQVQRGVTEQLDHYNTMRAGRLLIDFINDLSTWYVRRSRDRMKEQSDNNPALATLGYVLKELARLLAPSMPFLADYLYKDLTGQVSVHLASWEDGTQQSIDERTLSEMHIVRELVEFGLSLRKEAGVKVRQPLASVQYVLAGNHAIATELETILAEELNVKTVSAVESIAAADGWVKKQGSAGTLALDMRLTDELKAEGLARELERQIQDLRKKSGLKVGELVDVYYNTQDSDVEDILVRLVDRKKTFVNQISKSLEVEVDFETQAEVAGKALWIGINKI
jgi:isoleucyl-tRNA synthetase